MNDGPTALSDQRSLLKDRRIMITLLVCAALALSFWAGSRYPALDEKALMGGTAILEDPLGFEAVLPVTRNDSFTTRVWRSTINWLATNRQGMTFGVLMAAAFLTLFRLLADRRPKGRFTSTLVGVLLGAQLGVCVNCAAPIARGMHAAGARLETSLATMISSPTLNVIVITMMVALFPPYMVAMKLGLSLLFLLLVLPLLSRFTFGQDARGSTDLGMIDGRANAPVLIADEVGPPVEHWIPATLWVARNYTASLLFVARKTVPLMFLAGFIGAVVVSALPWEMTAKLLPRAGALGLMAATVGLALLGLTLPVPIALDVVICAGLLAAGVPAHYVMVLLFSLGIFSVYSFFIVWEAVSLRVATSLTLALFVLSVAAGGATFAYDRYVVGHQAQIFDAFVAAHSDHRLAHRERLPGSLAQTAHTGTPLAWQTVDVGSSEVVVERRAFNAATAEGEKLFTRTLGNRIGLERFDPTPLSYKLTAPYYRSYPIAAGDVDGDGRPDLVVGGTGGVQLFMNLDGRHFSERRIDVPELSELYAANAALVDLDNDGHLDLFVSVYRGGNHVIYNDGRGRFTQAGHRRLPESTANLAAASAFGDLDRDGDLDIYLGNWTSGGLTPLPPEGSRDVLLWNQDSGFVAEPMAESPSETLSVLFSDLDADGDLDIFAGMDFSPPDVLRRGDGHGELDLVSNDDGIIPVTPYSTMSIDAADINNDLRPDIYLSQITGGAPGQRERLSLRSVSAACDEYSDTSWRRRCLARAALLESAIPARRRGDARHCLAIEDQAGRDECTVLAMMRFATLSKDRELCRKIPAAWEDLSFLCEQSFAEPFDNDSSREQSGGGAFPQRRNRNVLLVAQTSGGYVERAEAMGVDLAGWSWNAKFADLDNDRWQDLFVVNGRTQRIERTSNMYFSNRGGEIFEERGDEIGLASHLATASYVYVDLDGDGDLDIVTLAVDGPIWVYWNGTRENYAIIFELRDEIGNHFGIGARVVVRYDGEEGLAQMRELKTGGGYVSYDPPTAHFGLAETDRIDRVEVHWATGDSTDIVGPLSAGYRYRITRRQSVLDGKAPTRKEAGIEAPKG